MTLPVVIVLFLGILCQPGESARRNSATAGTSQRDTWITGRKFQQEIDQPFSGSWSNLEFRQLLKEVAADRQVSIVLDRRIDPSAELPISVANGSFRTGMTSIAKQVGGDIAIPDNLVFLGPKSATQVLRTLIELRKLELNSKDSGISKGRRTELSRTKLFTSSDLETPRQVLESFATEFRLRITNAELLPHDLWAGMTLPDVSLIEALSLVLIQFDLTFRWTDAGEAVELVPIPETVSLERKYLVRKKPAEMQSLIRQTYPKLSVELTKNELVVNGSLEDHEAVAALIRGDIPGGPVKIEPPQPLRQQIFTLKAERVPVSALMKTLEESAVTFEYSMEDFKRAGIDLETRVDIDVKKATADEFFRSIFEPLGIQFQIDHLTVKLKPKR